MEHINIICVKWGDKYNECYVNNLYEMVKNNITIPFKFYCYTEDPNHLINDIIIIPIEQELEGWWNKLMMFKKGFGNIQGKCLFFDLDVIIQNNIECFINHGDKLQKIKAFWKDPSIVENPNEIRKRNTLNNSSILSWNTSDKRLNEIWDEFEKDKDYFLKAYVGIDRFIDWEFSNLVKTYDKRLVYSYREGVEWGVDTERFKYRPEFKVCIFHQKPDIMECLDHEVVSKHWNGKSYRDDIFWVGKGYGDSLKALSYMINVSPNKTIYYTCADERFRDHDKQTTQQKVEALSKLFDTDKKIYHIQRPPNFYFYRQKMWNVFYESKNIYLPFKEDYLWEGGGDYITINFPDQFQQKNISNAKQQLLIDFNSIVDYIKKNFKYVELNYKDNVSYAIQVLKYTKFHVGYLGGISYIASWMKVPQYNPINTNIRNRFLDNIINIGTTNPVSEHEIYKLHNN